VVNYVLTGVVLGLGGVLLAWWGNPPRTGACVSCFLENIVGALRLHANERMQYLRPEIPAFVLGALGAAAARRDLVHRSSGAFTLRFAVGVVLMIGCAVFMGCPLKLGLRLGAGDMTALTGAIGLAAGVFLGVQAVRGGFSLGRETTPRAVGGFLVPAMMAALLALAVVEPGFIAKSTRGAGADHAPLLASLAFGLVAGALAQRNGFCITGGVAHLFLWGRRLPDCPRASGMLAGVGAFVVAVVVASAATGQFSPGLVGQPSSNEDYGWGFLAMLTVGFGSILIRGCPFRQLVLAGSGDHDAGGAVLGMLAGAALVQDWGLAGAAAGTPFAGKIALLLGLAFLFAVTLAYRDRSA